MHKSTPSFVRTALVAALAFSLSACATKNAPKALDNVLLGEYVQPTEYKGHRAQQNFFETPSGRIAFTDHGAGNSQNEKTIVLLHGVPTSSWMYRKLIPKLTPNMRVVSVDLLGFGSSDKPKNKNDVYSPAAQAQRIEALLASRGVEDYTILMHDMGGLVAWEMLRNHPEKIDKLVVLNTIVDQDGFDHPNFDAGFITRQLIKTFSSPFTSVAILDRTLADLGLRGEYQLTEDECFGYVRPMREGADNALYSFFTGLNKERFGRLDDNQRLWPSYGTELLVMWGDKDETLTSRQIESLRAGFTIPESNIHVFPDNAHFLAEEIPDTIAEKVTVFIKG